MLAEIVAEMLVLKRDQERLERAHQREHQDHGQRHLGEQGQGDEMPPTIRMMNATGPSPLSCADRSAPQAGQLGRTVRKPWNSRPSPQAGQRQRRPEARAEGNGPRRGLSARPARCGRPTSTPR